MKKANVWRIARRTLAVLLFTAINLLFLDVTGALHVWLGWMAKLQFVPAVLASNFVAVAAVLLLTLLFGRVYCSVICPLGVYQDSIVWLSGKFAKKKLRFNYKPERKWVRYIILTLFVLALVFGCTFFPALLEPYSAYGRIASNLWAPLYRWGNNLLAFFAERLDSYAFYSVDVWLKSLPVFIVALVTFIILTVLAWRKGRDYCNTICPVGSFLGLVSRFAIFRPVINTDKCVNCTVCAKKCKASCIDFKNHKIDYSRCVACMDCLDNCSSHAIGIQPVWKRKAQEKESQAPDKGRRNFLAASTLVATAAAVDAREKKIDGGLAAIEHKKVPERETPVLPPGAWNINHFKSRCTACQLCITSCPNGVLRPSMRLDMLMKPEMSYERGYCRPECNICSQVCPAGAIRPVTHEDKVSVRAGHAVWLKDNCLLTEGRRCGNCASHCPAGALSLVQRDKDDPGSPRMIAVDTERCTGCGACENLCPVRPLSAIYVEGHEIQSLK